MVVVVDLVGPMVRMEVMMVPMVEMVEMVGYMVVVEEVLDTTLISRPVEQVVMAPVVTLSPISGF